MKPRHWKMMLGKLRIQATQNDVTFGMLWKADLNRNETTFRDIMSIATGEAVLERMLQVIKDRWIPKDFELVRYQGKCNLIRGWDEMFEELDEDLNNLSSMKLSQYYKTFEEEIAQWDDKLQKLKIILDVWIEVQKKWVYLESIFLGSSEIKEMLINEYTRFKGIDSEWTSLMKKVSSKPNIIETMSIQGLQKTLERLSDMLANIQKALGDYLETQRAAFARFYFIGDEDLLEIIGNSKDVAIVQRHFTKMYAGITALANEKTDGNDYILKMSSREGEVVTFKKPVCITEDPKINVWLTKVDN
jgi:dynein heavy chain 1